MALEDGIDGVKKAFESVADEIWEKRKFTPLKEKHMTTAKSTAHSQLFALLCSRRWSKCEQIQVREVTLCFFWLLTQYPRPIAITAGRASDKHSKHIDWWGLISRLCKYGSAGAKSEGEFQGKARLLLCNEGKHLQTVD